MAVPKPTAPATASVHHRPRVGAAYRTQPRTISPNEQTAPPNPARSWAMSGTSRGFRSFNSVASAPR